MNTLETLYNDFKTLLRQLTYLKSEIDTRFATKIELDNVSNQGTKVIEIDWDNFVRWVKNNVYSSFTEFTVIDDDFTERVGFTQGKSEILYYYVEEVYYNGNFEGNAQVGTLFVLPSRIAVDNDRGDYCDLFIVLNTPLMGKFLSQLFKANES